MLESVGGGLLKLPGSTWPGLPLGTIVSAVRSFAVLFCAAVLGVPAVAGGQESGTPCAFHFQVARRSHRASGSFKAPDAKYANYFEVGHNAFEFLIDFAHDEGQDDGPVCHTRIITNPASARTLLDLLRRSIEQYDGLRVGQNS